jgi:hypothetical protein
MSPRGTDYPTALVEVRLRDGRTLTGSTTVVRGDFADPVPAGEIVEKFVALVSGVLGAERARAVVEIVDQVETLKDVRDLTALLAQ